MRIARIEGNGVTIRHEENPQGQFLEVTDELYALFKTLIKPGINNEFTNFIEVVTQEEIDEINNSKIPQTISQMRFRMQLILSGISIESIYQMIETIEDKITREIIYTKFEYAQVFERKDESLLMMAQMMGLTKEQVDQIFIDADKIQEK